MEHKHLLINATFTSTPFETTDFTSDWIRLIVSKIDMELLYGPVSVHCNTPNNEGVSAFCLITTSHIALHSWEKTDPNLVQLDIYSCKDFDHHIILNELRQFSPTRLGCKYLDRAIDNTRGWQMGSEWGI